MPCVEGVPGRRVKVVFTLAWLLVASLFIFHASLLFEVAWQIRIFVPWLILHLGPRGAGKAIILGCFVVLFFAHLAEAMAWGLLIWRAGLVSSFSEGVYFSATSMTALGYGDVVLPPPWRLLGPLTAISGLLMFGCSTAFLFVVIQAVWEHQG
ncbi:ion channel [Thiocystis violacea]|uniref:ion channel n=1 Tax=Thiocystis violacea TaxID=13725 RepID=UPI0019067D02|nr:ion channel [Thiocystis violacea]MBK1716977.1 ion transporter [Thiocystis violacea]